jgi:hypothetical protein
VISAESNAFSEINRRVGLIAVAATLAALVLVGDGAEAVTAED